MVKRLIKYIFLAIILVAIFVGGYVYLASRQTSEPQSSIPRNLEKTAEGSSDSTLPTKTEVTSPDGKYMLTETKINSGDNRVTQIFTTTSVKTGKAVEILKEESNPNEIYSIPQNTFSPDDKYLFLKKELSGTKKYYVLRTDGENITKEKEAVEVASLFEASRYSDYKITEATGWGGIDLLIVNTNNPNGSQGPSFWYSVTTNSFIRLSDRFN